MNVFFRSSIHLFVLIVSISSGFITPMAMANDLELQPAFLSQNANEYLRQDIGYLVKQSLLDDNFFSYPRVLEAFDPFKSNLASAYHISAEMKVQFRPLVKLLTEFIDDHKKGIMNQCEENPQMCNSTFEELNGITESKMAEEIVKSSYCFGTDPFLVSSKIRQESRFDMNSVSPTGAVGLTQLTAPGIKEILDQLGNRGAKYAFIDNKDFIVKATRCYGGQAAPFMLKDFPKINTYKSKTGGVEYSSETIRALKGWLLPLNKASSPSMRYTYIKRQIFMGQVLLKIYLAYSKQARPRNPMISYYTSALRMFNGDDIRVQYAKEVIKYSRLNML